MNGALPWWVEALTAALVLIGALAALLGSFGVLRLKSFFQRVHAPTLGATLGTWGFSLAYVVQGSYLAGQPYLHALLIGLFIAVTAPVTTLFLLRAAAFRARMRGKEIPVPGAQLPPLV
jgi:multicomponent K+:H+ antiporter subunit G